MVDCQVVVRFPAYCAPPALLFFQSFIVLMRQAIPQEVGPTPALIRTLDVVLGPADLALVTAAGAKPDRRTGPTYGAHSHRCLQIYVGDLV